MPDNTAAIGCFSLGERYLTIRVRRDGGFDIALNGANLTPCTEKNTMFISTHDLFKHRPVEGSFWLESPSADICICWDDKCESELHIEWCEEDKEDWRGINFTEPTTIAAILALFTMPQQLDATQLLLCDKFGWTIVTKQTDGLVSTVMYSEAGPPANKAMRTKAKDVSVYCGTTLINLTKPDKAGVIAFNPTRKALNIITSWMMQTPCVFTGTAS